MNFGGGYSVCAHKQGHCILSMREVSQKPGVIHFMFLQSDHIAIFNCLRFCYSTCSTVGLFSCLDDPQQLQTGRNALIRSHTRGRVIRSAGNQCGRPCDLCHMLRLGLLWMVNPSAPQLDSCCVTQDQVPLKADTFQIVLCFKSTYAS